MERQRQKGFKTSQPHSLRREREREREKPNRTAGRRRRRHMGQRAGERFCRLVQPARSSTSSRGRQRVDRSRAAQCKQKSRARSCRTEQRWKVRLVFFKIGFLTSDSVRRAVWFSDSLFVWFSCFRWTKNESEECILDIFFFGREMHVNHKNNCLAL